MTTLFRELEAEALAAMTPAERAAFDTAEVEAEARLQAAEMVYSARTAAGITQRQLAERAGTSPATISAVENGAHLPGLVLLDHIARALGRGLTLSIQPIA